MTGKDNTAPTVNTDNLPPKVRLCLAEISSQLSQMSDKTSLEQIRDLFDIEFDLKKPLKNNGSITFGNPQYSSCPWQYLGGDEGVRNLAHNGDPTSIMLLNAMQEAYNMANPQPGGEKKYTDLSQLKKDLTSTF